MKNVDNANIFRRFFKLANPGLFFFIFVFSIQLTEKHQYKFLPMTRFELRTSGVGSNRSTNWATTTAPKTRFLHWPIPAQSLRNILCVMLCFNSWDINQKKYHCMSDVFICMDWVALLLLNDQQFYFFGQIQISQTGGCPMDLLQYSMTPKIGPNWNIKNLYLCLQLLTLMNCSWVQSDDLFFIFVTCYKAIGRK